MSGEAVYQFLDTNILVYAHDTSAGPKHVLAKSLLAELWSSRLGCLSVQVLQEFYVNATRKVARPLTSQEAAQIIVDLSVWRVHAPRADDVVGAIEISQSHGIAFWDAMVVRSASQLGCKLLWSEDLNPGQVYEGVRAVNPFQTRFQADL